MNFLKIKYYYSVAIAALLFFGTSCKIQEPEFKGVNDVSVGSLESDNIEITINVKLDNPNNFKIKVIKAKLDVLVGGNDAGVANLQEKVIIRKRTEDNYDIIISTDKEKLMAAGMKAIIPSLATGKVTVKVRGWVKGRIWGIGKKIDVEFKENVDLDMLKGLKK